jgi:hypothetical protein
LAQLRLVGMRLQFHPTFQLLRLALITKRKLYMHQVMEIVQRVEAQLILAQLGLMLKVLPN